MKKIALISLLLFSVGMFAQTKIHSKTQNGYTYNQWKQVMSDGVSTIYSIQKINGSYNLTTAQSVIQTDSTATINQIQNSLAEGLGFDHPVGADYTFPAVSVPGNPTSTWDQNVVTTYGYDSGGYGGGCTGWYEPPHDCGL